MSKGNVGNFTCNTSYIDFSKIMWIFSDSIARTKFNFSHQLKICQLHERYFLTITSPIHYSFDLNLTENTILSFSINVCVLECMNAGFYDFYFIKLINNLICKQLIMPIE